MAGVSGARRGLVLAALALALAGCARRAPDEREVVVFAAASLRDVFDELAAAFRRDHPGVKVTLQYAGTQELRAQLEHGARADVFASADTRHMAELVRAGRVAAPVVFATNEPVLIVSREAAVTVTSLRELPRATRVIVGAPDVPIGRYTGEVLERARAAYGDDFRARVEARVVSRELSVRQVLAKVRLGEADAGVVYRTDARGVDSVVVVPIPPELSVRTEYPIALVDGAPHATLGRAWLEHVTSQAGRQALSRAGFSAPGEAR